MRRILIPAAVTLTGLALVALLIYGLGSHSASRSLDNAVGEGRHPAAPVQTVPLLDGSGSASLAAYRGQVVLVNFWASWCVPCQTEAPLLQRAQRAFQSRHATVLGVTFRDAAPDARSFVTRYALSYPEWRDPSGSMASAFGSDQVPESFVIDRQGRVAAIWRGELTQAFVDRAVALAARS